MSIFFVILEFAFINAAVCPREHSSAAHLVVLPLAIVGTSIAPLVDSPARDVIQVEVPMVSGSISPDELAHALLLPVLVGALVPGSVLPRLHAMPVLLVLDPVAFVHGAAVVRVLAAPVGLVVFPLALVHVPVGVYHPADTDGFAVAPLAFVDRAIDPDLAAFTHALLQVRTPLADVNDTTYHSERALVDHGALADVLEWHLRDLKRADFLIYLLDSFVEEQVFFSDCLIEFAVLLTFFEDLPYFCKPPPYEPSFDKRLDLDNIDHHWRDLRFFIVFQVHHVGEEHHARCFRQHARVV